MPSLKEYWRARYPSYDLAPHIELMIDELEHLGDSEGLIMTMPPRHSKTETVKAWLEWQIGKEPTADVMYTSYSIRLAQSASRSIRNEITTGNAFGRFFPNVQLAAAARAATDWGLEAGGLFRAAGVGGSITGMGANIAVIDDPMKDRKDAESLIIREGRWEWFVSALLTRLTPNAKVVIMHTRWHPDDLAGRILQMIEEQGSPLLGGIRWRHLNLPALAEENDPLGREAGGALWPARFNKEKLEGMRAADEYNFEALYQQRPRKRGGQIFSDTPARFTFAQTHGSRIVIAADTASSQRKTADYTAFCVLSVQGRGVDLVADVLEVQRGRMNLGQLSETAAALQRRYGVPILMEETAQSQPILQHLAMQRIQVRPQRPIGDKFTRAAPAATAWNAGRIRVPMSAPWLPEFLSELASFTGTTADIHDDQVDALSYAFNLAADTPVFGVSLQGDR